MHSNMQIFNFTIGADKAKYSETNCSNFDINTLSLKKKKHRFNY